MPNTKILACFTRTICFAILLVFFLSPAGAAEKSALDPAEIGVNARPLSLGRAYTALGDDANAIFINPAALGWMKGWQLTAMAQKLLTKIPYYSLAGAMSTSFGNVGIAYLNSNIGELPITASGTPAGSAGNPVYSNSVTAISYGADLKNAFPDVSILKDTTFGASIKLFNQNFSDTTEVAYATGYDLDLGVQYQASSWLKLGISELNALPASQGAKLTWSGGYAAEPIPSLSKVGMAVKIVGKDGLFQAGNQGLNLSLDGNFSINRTTRPGTVNVGLEWWPAQYLALRAGLDQDFSAGAISNNLAAGVGINYNGTTFDYAYHTYGEVADNTTHTFSLSLGMNPPEPKPVVKEKAKVEVFLRVNEPEDKLITYANNIMVKGEINPDVNSAEINGQLIPISGNVFEVVFPLEIGKNSLQVRAVDEYGQTLQVVKVRILRLTSFSDISWNFWAKDAIDQAATLGLITGFPEGTFKPGAGLNRAELVTLLGRVKGFLATEKDTGFEDVPTSHWAAGYIKAGVDSGIVTGYPDQTFKPNNDITRAEGIAVMARFDELVEPLNLEEPPYADVPVNFWAAKWIAAAKEAGLLRYLAALKPFEPAKRFTRAEAVVILNRTKVGEERINDLLNFDSGY